MRTIGEIKADMKRAEDKWSAADQIRCIRELESAEKELCAWWDNLPLERRQAICTAERDGRCVVLSEHKYKIGEKVKKINGGEWHGVVVGFYSTEITPIGYAVESEREKGSVQIYPEAALKEGEGK